MQHRWLLACGLGLVAAPARSQPAAYSSLSVFDTAAARVVPAGTPPPRPAPVADCDRPTELPPLLPVPPSGMPPPRTAGPRGPAGEYDPGYLYLPERAPESERAERACGPAGRFWFSPSLELGGTRAASLPVLLRAGTATGPVVYGGERLRAPTRAGLGLNGGFWLDAQNTRGIDASFYYLGQGGNDTLVFSNAAALRLPTAGGGAFALADPAAGVAGAYQAGLNTRFSSADVNYRRNLFCGESGRLDALAGYRYADLGEDFTIYGKRLGPGGEIVRFRDDITAVNHFHGGQVGLAGELRLDRWFVTGTGKVAFGTVFTDTNAAGKFRVNDVVLPVGFYSRPGLDGPRDHAQFAVMPTAGVTLGRQLGAHGRVYVGYNFLYLNHVTRGPDVLDPAPPVAANPHQLLNAAAGRRAATTSDFWAQSVSGGLEWRY